MNWEDDEKQFDVTNYEVFTIYDRKSPKHSWTKQASYAQEYHAIDAAENHLTNLRIRVTIDRRWKNGEVGMVREIYSGRIKRNLPKNTIMQQVWRVNDE